MTIRSPVLVEVRTSSEPFLIFLVSRVLMFAVIAFGQILVPRAANTRPGPYPNSPFLDGWFHWDAGWYLGIASSGYWYDPVKQIGNVAFFPLYPMLVRLAGYLVGNVDIAALVVSNLCLAIAMVLLYRLALLKFDVSVARRALVFLCVFPFAFFYSAVYTESLFLLLAVAAFWFAERDQWWLAGICGLFCTMTRLVGMAIGPGLLLLYLERRDWSWRRLDWAFFALGLVPLGLGIFMGYLQLRFHDPMAFYIASLYGWGRHNLFVAIADGTWGWVLPTSLAPGDYDLVLQINLVLALIWLGLTGLVWRRLGPGYAVFVLISTLVPLTAGLESLGRYVAVLFPVYLALATWIRRAVPLQITVAASAGLLALFTVLFANSYWII